MLDKIYDYISDNEFKFTIYEDKIHVVNYKRIISLEDDYISFQSNNKKISIIGYDLSLVKLLNDEMLVRGTINKIEVSDV